MAQRSRILRTHAGGLGLLLLSVPLASVAMLMGPGFVADAAGCSAVGGYLPGWNNFLTEDDPALPVDGVIVFTGTFTQIDADAARAAVTITVTDDNAQNVAGSAELIETDPETGSTAKVVWKPSAALQPGSGYTVSWSVETSHSGDAIVGAATVTTTADSGVTTKPIVIDTSSRTETLLTGDVVSCERSTTGGASCPQSPTVSFASVEVDQVQAFVVADVPKATTSQALLLEVQEVPGKGAFVSPPYPSVVATAAWPKGAVNMAFSESLPEYCVRLRTTDLRDDQVVDDQEVCIPGPEDKAPASPLSSYLGQCLTPPSGGLKDAWCAQHADAAECADDSAGCACELASPRKELPTSPWAAFAAVALSFALRRRRRADA